MAAIGLPIDLPAHESAAARRALPWLVGAAAVAGTVLSAEHATAPGSQVALMAWITLSYVFAGLIALWRRPGTPFGRLMVLAGFGMFLSSLSVSDVPALFTLGIAFDLAAAVLFLHVFLAFPTGRLSGRVDRALVAAGYFTAFALQLVGMALGGFGPDNLARLVDAPHAAELLLRGQLLALSALALAGVGVLAARRRRSGPPLRRPVALLVESFAAALVALACLYISCALGLSSGLPIVETVRRATFFAIGLGPLAFLAGLLDARLARSAVGDLFVALRDQPGPAGLRGALARALRDPSLTLAYWLPEYAVYADGDGRPVALPDGADTRATTFVARHGAPVAALIHDTALLEDPALLEAVSAAAAIALENARLSIELRTRLDELKGSRARIVAAGDAERRRLERNLHDGAQQRLVGIAMQLRLLQSRIRQDPDGAAAIAGAVSDEVAESLAELRDLARGLHPAVLEHGLAAALNALAARSPIPTTVCFEAPAALSGAVELAAYFVASEALANVAKYSGATAATVSVRRHGDRVRIAIADDGAGGADAARGSGLRGLADRVAALDGRLLVDSPPGAGTVVTAELPSHSQSSERKDVA